MPGTIPATESLYKLNSNSGWELFLALIPDKTNGGLGSYLVQTNLPLLK
jgi:hypothetical protein